MCKIHVAVIIHRSATQVASSSFPGITQLSAFRFYCAHFSHPHIWMMLSTKWTAPLPCSVPSFSAHCEYTAAARGALQDLLKIQVHLLPSHSLQSLPAWNNGSLRV